MKRFSAKRAAAIHEIGYMKIRSGSHRFIYVWVVVVKGRVFVRSWNDKAGGWYRAFRKNPRGAILVGRSAVPVRAVAIKSARLIDAISEGYALKYTTKSNKKYVRGVRTVRRKWNTIELVP